MPAPYLWIALALTAALGYWAWLRLASRPKPLPAPGAKRSALVASPVTVSPRNGATPPPAAPTDPNGASPPVPPELLGLVWRRESDLTPQQRQTLVTTMSNIARPPGPLLQLLSPTFLANTSARELSELLASEPLLAAKLLGRVNAPMYGLRRAVTAIDQAVALLGIKTVHSICVQHLLAQAVVPTHPAQQSVIETLWRSSAIASELGARLGKALNLPDQGSLPTRAVLGFIGPVAIASRLPPEALGGWLDLPRHQRAQREQALLGVNAGEIGGLLMAAWGLPQTLVDEVSGASRWLGMPVEATDPTNTPRLAMAYLCTNLGERLATGRLASLKDHDFMEDPVADSFYLRRYLSQPSLHLRSYLGHPAAQRLQTALQSPEVLAAVQHMLTPTEV